MRAHTTAPHVNACGVVHTCIARYTQRNARFRAFGLSVPAMREVALEQHLSRECNSLGGWALKLVCPGNAGVPDRLVVLPGGIVGFLELKAPGERPRPLQVRQMERLGRLGATVGWTDSHEGVNAWLAALAARPRQASLVTSPLFQAGKEHGAWLAGQETEALRSRLDQAEREARALSAAMTEQLLAAEARAEAAEGALRALQEAAE